MKTKTQAIFVRDAESRLVSMLVEPVLLEPHYKQLRAELRALRIYVERFDTVTTADRRFTGLKVADHSGVPWSAGREHQLAQSVSSAARTVCEVLDGEVSRVAASYAVSLEEHCPRLCA